MAGGCATNVFIILFVVFSLIASCLSYLEYNLENNKVCSMIRKRELNLLKENENSAIILKELRYFDNWSGPYPFVCNFTVKAPWGYGIIAVIQNLSLRQNESIDECIDYVQFQKRSLSLPFAIFKSDVIKSPQYCGRVNSIRDPDDDEEETGEMYKYAHNAFVDEKGHLDVTISVAGQRLLQSQKLDIAITFTAFKGCKHNDQDGLNLKECKKGSGICIWEGFFHDKYVNCPFDDCFDESGCPVISGGKKQSSGLGTTVTIGAVVMILGLLLLFMLCLFVCRRCQVLCWSGPPAPRPQRSVPQSVRVEMMTTSGTSGETTRHSQPTAPPLLPISQTASPVHEDKDLPPPYESLFPSR